MRAVRLMNAFGDRASHVILSGVPGELGARDAIAQGIAVDFPTNAPSLQGRPSWARYREMAAYMRQFDLVLTYNWGAMDVLASKRLFPKNGPPIVHHEDGFNADEASRLFLRRTLFRRAVLPAAAHLVVPSATLERIARQSWRQPSSRLSRIANGICTVDYAARPDPQALPGFVRGPADIIIGTIAGLRPVKNIARLIRAFATLPGHARLLIVGEGPDRATLLETATRLGVADRVIMPGHVGGPHRYIGHFDVFALSSDSEQAPIALIEAMAAGLPAVATNVGDVREMLSQENRSFVVDRDDEAGFANRLGALVQDRGLRHSIGQANQRTASASYDEADMIARYAAVYGFSDQ